MTKPPQSTAVLTKAVAEIAPGADDATSENGTFEVILSAPTLDRDGDTLAADEWKMPLPDHITFDTDHGMSVATTVGSGVPRVEADGTLRVSGSYSSIDRAQEVRTLVNEGHIRTTSVAFMTEKSAKGAKGPVVRELLNGAFVAVPSNREAVVLSSKALAALEQETKEGRRHGTADVQLLQAAHDSVVVAGASCSNAKGFRGGVAVKSIIGSVEALQDRVSDALEDAYGSRYGYWGWLRGVIPNDTHDGGTVIFESSALSEPDTYDLATYSQGFTDDGTVVTLTGTATEVDIHEVVAPDADADREGQTKSQKTDPDLTDKAAGSGSEDEGDVDVQLRAAAIRANAALL